MRTGSIGGFTLVEALVAIALIGVGVSTTIAALTKFNQFASVSRNATGAYAAVMNQIDLIESATGIPQDAANNILIRPPQPPAPAPAVPSVPMNGTQTLPAAGGAPIAIYRDSLTNTIVPATSMTTTVTPVVVGGVTMYQARVTVNYTYLSKAYSFSMTTLRASDQ